MAQKSIPTITISKDDGSNKRRINACDLPQYADKGYSEHDTSKEFPLTASDPASAPATAPPELTISPESAEINPDAGGDPGDEFDALSGEMPETVTSDPSDALSDTPPNSDDTHPNGKDPIDDNPNNDPDDSPIDPQPL